MSEGTYIQRPPDEDPYSAWLPVSTLEESHRFLCCPGIEDKEAVFPEPLDVCATCGRVRLAHKYQYSLSLKPTIEWCYQLVRNVELLESRMDKENLR